MDYILRILSALSGCVLIYVLVMWQVMRKDNPLLKVNKGTHVINLGSTYAYYDIDYNGFEVGGVNLANYPQYLDYDEILLKKCVNKLTGGAKIILTFPNFVFAGYGTDPVRRRYYEVLLPWEMKKFSLKALLSFIMKAAAEPFTHEYEKDRNKWKGYTATDSEKYGYALKRIRDWENPDGTVQIPSVKGAEITSEHLARIETNKDRVLRMIELCANHGMEVFLLLFPSSEIMKKEIAEECLEVYLRKPLASVLEQAQKLGYRVKLLDYSEDYALSDLSLYMNGDCFNQRGRRLFTELMLKDIGLLQ